MNDNDVYHFEELELKEIVRTQDKKYLNLFVNTNTSTTIYRIKDLELYIDKRSDNTLNLAIWCKASFHDNHFVLSAPKSTWDKLEKDSIKEK